MANSLLFGASVVFEPRPALPRRGWIYLGMFEPGGLLEASDGAALSLNHKRSAGDPLSTTRYVCQRDSTEITAWAEALGMGADSTTPFEGLTLNIEDASPDTCLALIALVARLRGGTIPPAWTDYADRWESGDVHTTGDPDHSFGVLENALVHPYFDAAMEDWAAQALGTGVAYAQALMASCDNPAAIPIELPVSLHAQAHGRLAQERQRYEQSIRSGTVLQLSLPMTGTHRRRLIDMVELLEVEPTGSLKAWLRRDGTSPTGLGYSLMALYRPNAAGTGNDMTVSVDPAASVHLFDLWLELERREDEAWRSANEVRPRGLPRSLRVYDQRPECSAIPCDQPWYDGGDLTLVGAPRAFSSPAGGKQQLGTKLAWADVIDALWRTYRPDGGILGVARGASVPQPLLDEAARAATPLHGSPMRLVDLSCVRSGGERPILSPTLHRALAACLSGVVPEVHTLPSPADFDVFEERGGWVVVSRQGLAMVQITDQADFPAQALAAVARSHAYVLARALHLRALLRAAADQAVLAVRTGRQSAARRALTDIYRILSAARWRLDDNNPIADAFVARVATAIETRWNAGALFNSVVEEAKDLQEFVVTSSEVRAANLLRGLSIYGFPALLFGAVIGDIFLPMADKQHGTWMGIAWSALLFYLLLTAAMTAIVHHLNSQVNARWARALGEVLDLPVAEPQPPQERIPVESQR